MKKHSSLIYRAYRVFEKNTILYALITSIVLIFCILYSYRNIFQTYFLFDEWLHYQFFLENGPFTELIRAGWISNLTGGTRFLGTFLEDIYIVLFGLNVTPFVFTFIVFHIINTLLLLRLLIRLRIHLVASCIASLFFAIASAGQQAISWPAAGLQILGATLFMLVALYLTSLSYDNKSSIKYLFLACICSYISFLWKPTGIVTPILVVILFLLFKASNFSARYRVAVICFGCTAVALGIYRLLVYFSWSFSVFWKGVFLSVFYPLISISHVFIPFRLMFRLSHWFTLFVYPQMSLYPTIEQISYFVVCDFLSVVISLVLLFFLFLLYQSCNDRNKKLLVFGLCCYAIPFIPVAIYWMDRGTSYLESRHLYPSIIGVSVILGVVFDSVIRMLKKRNKVVQKVGIIVFTFFISIWYIKEMSVTQREVRESVRQGREIKQTWESLQKLPIPDSEKVVLYFESPRTYFYQTYFLPFQLNSEYMIALAYYHKPFMNNGFADNLKPNSYVNSGNKLFGIYTNKNALLPLVLNNTVSIDNIYGFQFNDKNYSFENITEKIRAFLSSQM